MFAVAATPARETAQSPVQGHEGSLQVSAQVLVHGVVEVDHGAAVLTLGDPEGGVVAQLRPVGQRGADEEQRGPGLRVPQDDAEAESCSGLDGKTRKASR